MNVREETKSSALFRLASHENVFAPWMVFEIWQKIFCHHLRQEFGFLPLWMLYICLWGDGLTE